jgi:GNAT superfamily N-acetyltransferase
MPMTTEPDVTIRPARRDEREGVISLALELIQATPYADAALLGRATRASLGALVDLVFDAGERGVILVAEDVGLIGFLALVDVVHPMTGERLADELGWWVVPTHQHQRVGLSLLRQAEAWARGRGLHTLRLGAPLGTELPRFYEALGYRAVEIAFVTSLDPPSDDGAADAHVH